MCERLKKSNPVVNPFKNTADKMRPLLDSFESFIKRQAMRFEIEVRTAAKECINPKGKFLRPILVFASAYAGKYNKQGLLNRAAIVELTHLSTLIHDDVIDNAQMRRSSITANKKFGAKTAILLGDTMFANTVIMALEEENFELSRKVAQAVKTICEGEIRQTLKKQKQAVTRKRYYEIAYGKTAVFFELACWLGASATDFDRKWATAASEAGKQLGIAYQIYDDICDWFMSESDAGKTLGTDLASGKQTFPLILLAEKLSPKQKKTILKNLEDANPLEITEKMRELKIPQECEKEFVRRINLAEKAIAPFKKESLMLAEFCTAMRSINLG